MHVAEPRSKPSDTIYQLRVGLQSSEPHIWRSVQVPADMTLGDLHTILQIVMEWYEEHLHEFEIRGGRFGSEAATDGTPWMDAVVDEDRVKLIQLALTLGATFTYTYDFGDDWVHIIEVEKVLPPEEGAQYPACIDGARAAPPEDCGGIWGYASKLEILNDPEDEEYEWVHEWMGDWDPERFDIDTINECLHRAFAKRSSRRT